MTIYLAGPMTGLPEHNTPAFDHAEALLTNLGYTVLSPARMLREHPRDSIREHLARDVEAICSADAIVLLPGWETSPGVALEIHLAEYLALRGEALPRWTLAEVLEAA